MQTIKYTDKIMKLRSDGACSMLFKGFLTLDWVGDRFVHQAGPYVMGLSGKRQIAHDKNLLKPIWRYYQTGWIKNGRYAYDTAAHIYQNGPNTTIGMAGQFAGGYGFRKPCAQILWECDKPYDAIFDKVIKRRCVDMV